MTGDLITRTHPLYDLWQPTWDLLQQVYRGDGGFLDGTNLLPHPREIVYLMNADGSPSTTIQGYKDKFTRRKKLSRYENFARTIVDTFGAHLFSKNPARNTDTEGGIEDWWEDVDGGGTHMSDWMAWEESLAWVYGHVVALMDRADPEVDTPRTRAEQGSPVLRVYTPLDVLDWVYVNGRYTALKVCEARPRDSITDGKAASLETRGRSDGAPKDLTFVVWTEKDWTRYDDNGVVIDRGDHQFGCVPAVLHRARPIPGMPSMGASLLGDPRLHRDHFNLVSELRELLRAQTFSMLNIQLAENEDVGTARGRLGEAASVETVIWSRGTAQFIAPPDGPAAIYQKEIEALERKLFRMAGLPWEGDGAGAESADSRRLKAMDLNRLLATYADECERVEYALAKLWYRATAGLTDEDQIEAAMERDGVVIRYPDEFATIDVAQAAADVRDIQTLGLGETAVRIAKERALPILLPDLNAKDADAIKKELKAAADEGSVAQAGAAFRAKVAGAAPQKPAGMADGDEDGGQMQDEQGAKAE